jgi:aminotransferase
METQPSLPDYGRFLNRALRRVPPVGSRGTDARTAALARSGREVIELKAHPSRSLPPHVLEAVARAAREHISPPSRGLPEFLHALACALERELSIRLDPDRNLLATAGGMHALWLSCSSILNPGDEILAPSPCYFLEGIVQPLGARIVYAAMEESRGYAWDFDLLAAKITSRTKCLFVNTPLNPTGRVLTGDELASIAELAATHDLILIADESYDTLVYDGRRHRSLAALAAAWPRTLLIRSFTKSFAMPGWRVGCIAGPAPLIEQFTKALEWNMLYGACVNQAAAAAALSGPRDWLNGVADEFQQGRDLLCKRIQEIGTISAVTPAGGPFLFINTSRLRAEAEDIARVLLEDFGIPTTAGDYLQGPRHVRLAFGAGRDTLLTVAERLSRAIAVIGVRMDDEI